MYVTGSTADAIFTDVKKMSILGNEAVPVVKLEHLAALKVFAMKNDPSRRLREMADIHCLVHLPGVNMEEVRGYFEKYGLSKTLDEISGKEKMTLIEIDKDLEWSREGSPRFTQKQSGKRSADLDAYLDFLDAIQPFRPATVKSETSFF